MWRETFPKPRMQAALVLLLLAILLGSCVTLYLWAARPDWGRLGHPQRWAATVSGLSVCAAFFQYATTSWLTEVKEVFGDAQRFPYGPPSHIARKIMEDPDRPIWSSVKHYVFYDPAFAVALAFWAGLFTVLAAWID